MIGADETAIWNLMNGLSREPIQIGWLYPGYRRALGVRTAIVWLTSYTIDHVALGRHGDRYYQDICLTPTIIFRGECRKISDKRLSFVYSPASDKFYRTVIKSAAAGAEVYLASTYRIKNHRRAKLLQACRKF